ncbi:MAG TPA: BlaI/MecI/CopY family transcriptional regulator [Fimbriimonadaceae bacterium]|nr:BlaI/MecI/CopY family transcriptional regulator [Fimbriimonadaceae bacterium]
MRRPPLGELELEVLQYVSDHAPCTVREVAEVYADPRGLARTTILTVMERLRQKGYLARKKEGGSFAYTPAHEKSEVMQDIVKDFIEKTLGGSLSPFVAYLAKEKGLTPGEVDKLRELVESMDEKEKK